jgi:hypothetical protein
MSLQIKTCAMTTLRTHSAGDKYAPVLAGDYWHLKNAKGQTLCGYRGKIFDFESEKNARNWLCTNLSRVKNADHDVSIEHQLLLGEIYLDTGDEFVLQEIYTIYDLNANRWQAVECVTVAVNDCDCANENWDGGNAFSVYI